MKYKYKLYGAILGDLAGQPFEFPVMKGPYDNVNIHNPDSKFTDDTVMTLAGAKSILYGSNIAIEYKDLGNRYPEAGYGKGFKAWLKQDYNPLFYTKGNSWGNGCLMRASPFMYIDNSLSALMESVMCSHHDDISYESVIKLYNVYKHGSKEYIKANGLKSIDKFEKFEVRADKTVDFCINTAIQSYGVHRGIIKAIQAGGDTDTNASIVGELCNHTWEDISKKDAEYVESSLDPYLRDILINFNKKF